MPPASPKASKNSLLSLLKPYKWLVGLLVALTVAGNALNLAVPQIIAHAIDSFTKGGFNIHNVIIEFALVAAFIFIFTYLQAIVQTYASEKVARDLRKQLVSSISLQDYIYIQTATPAKLLTNLTSDVDNVKTFVSQAIAALISSLHYMSSRSRLCLALFASSIWLTGETLWS